MDRPMIIGQSDFYVQEIEIAPAVLKYVDQYRQTSHASREAGGQLFGAISSATLSVMAATGPYFLDSRSRYHYRSHPRSAQKAINNMWSKGYLYLGEWHTHAEDFPSPSNSDDDAMRRIVRNSKLNSTDLIMLIVGRSRDLSGYKLMTINMSKCVNWGLHYCSLNKFI